MDNKDIQDLMHEMHTAIVTAAGEFRGKLDKAAREGYLGDLYRTDYTVQGVEPFPLDMLRYACSWPMHETDAREIEQSVGYDNDERKPREVRLSRSHRDPVPVLHESRWESYHWKVIRRDTVKL